MAARRGLPLVPTLMTLPALALLVGLGVWQLQRAEWKDALLARLAEAPALPEVSLSSLPEDFDFRRARAHCRGDLPVRYEGGQSADGRPGFVARVTCPPLGRQPAFEADLGWQPRPTGAGRVSLDTILKGLLRDRGADRSPRVRLVAEAPPPGLALAPARLPSLADVPANHRAYAGQWFFFATVLAVIYAAFVWRWRRGG
ncbi:MAG: SURF1 family cytochrome oxidase biogenesis protein [Sphingomonadaceae bacterium]